jgi:hypothetical protein
MKFAAVILLACFAVSNAAFTANLVQRTTPMIQQAIFKLRLANGRADDLQTSLFQQLQQEAQEVMAQIQATVAAGQQVASDVVNHLADLQSQMSSLASSAIGGAVDVISGFWNNLMGTLFGNSRSAKFFGAVVDNLGNMVNQVIDGFIAQATELVQNFNLNNLLQTALNHLFTKVTGRGFFGDLFGQIATAGSNAWDAITGIFSNAVSVAGDTFNAVQAMAAEFVQEAATNIHAITSDAANDFLEFIKPYANDLGTLYDQVQGVVTQIGKN